ncbi:metallophosphoesterase family protein [Dinghuibacter silviterrae]|uniref:Calcineurin-like phosphoesterase family protein n=1 Tax=Dinghuibacter silviterrae TaxID=1539049 RepID=A0A4R8DUP1_9BACT|nr:metallophosphoesterase [Dinghuibacter silviterrae]TDX02110.1 calcineurin-like phosphoesterase family protein [Dinghuibacter silviterrae]
MRRHSGLLLIFILLTLSGSAQNGVLQFVFTSDVHYGITRHHFRGADDVPSTVVNRAMIAAINQLPSGSIPEDGGVGAGQAIGHIDAILITGDIANREEKGVQSAATSWGQFEADYDHLLGTKDWNNKPTPILLSPGNHDVSDAVGFWRPMTPGVDASSMAGIYNRMMKPTHPLTAATYNYTTDKIHFIRNIGGIRLLFVDCWPDSTDQAWAEQHLKGEGPVFLFTHSNPDVEPRFFTNPNGNHGVDSVDKFENLLPELYQDGQTVEGATLIEQRGLAGFLQRHPEIKAYFHGHNNYTEFYQWQGPDKNISIPCFRVDSPMKGKFSSKNETLLSFELVTIDTKAKTMTVRECFWNSVPGDPSVLKWGEVKTMGL